jgi:hypothetical protein
MTSTIKVATVGNAKIRAMQDIEKRTSSNDIEWWRTEDISTLHFEGESLSCRLWIKTKLQLERIKVNIINNIVDFSIVSKQFDWYIIRNTFSNIIDKQNEKYRTEYTALGDTAYDTTDWWITRTNTDSLQTISKKGLNPI